MQKRNRQESGRRDMSLRRELIYLLIFVLLLGSFNIDWSGVRNASGIGGNAGTDELYIVEAKDLDDGDALNDDFFDDGFDLGQEPDEYVFEDEDIEGDARDVDGDVYDETDETAEEDDAADDEWNDDAIDSYGEEEFDDGDVYSEEDIEEEDADEEYDWDSEEDVSGTAEENVDFETAYTEMPAGVLYQESESGMRVRADFGENVFPAGTYMELTDVPKREALQAASDAVDNVVDAAGVDIAFYSADGEELEPQDGSEVRVILSLDASLAKGSGRTVIHIGDDGGATELSDEDVVASSLKSAVFTAEEFSLYLLVTTGETVAVATPSTEAAVSPSSTPSTSDSSSVTESVVFTARGTLTTGETKTLSVQFKSGNKEVKNVNWSSSDTSAVGISNEGKDYCTITGKKATENPVTITVAVESNGGKTYIATREITVVELDIELPYSAIMKLDEEQSMTAKVTGISPDSCAYQWESVSPSVVSVSEETKNKSTCTLYAAGTGETTITVTVTDDEAYVYKESCTVTVTPSTVTGVKLDKTTMTLTAGETGTLTATVDSSDATSKGVRWESSDPTVATVDKNGKVTAVRAGTATVTVTTADGNHKATCTVTVKVAGTGEEPAEGPTEPVVTPSTVTGVTLDKTTMTLTVGGTDTLTATVSPENATNKNVTWSSNNEDVVTVDAGKVTAVGAGTAKVTVTVTAEEKSFTDTCEVTVTGTKEEPTEPAEDPTEPETPSTVTDTIEATTEDNRSSADKALGAGLVSATVFNAKDENLILLLDAVDEDDKMDLTEEIAGNSLSYDKSYFFDLSLVDEDEIKVENDDFGSCLITMKIPTGMLGSGGALKVVSLDENGDLEQLLSVTGTINGKENCVQFITKHFSPFAFLYTGNSSSSSSSTDTANTSNASSAANTTNTVYRYITGSSGSGSGSVRYVYVDDDDDTDTADSNSDSGTTAKGPRFKQVRWWGTDKSTFYWTKKKGATGYRLQYSTDASFKKAKTKAVNSKKKQATVTGMEKNKTYYVRVRAYKKLANGKTTWKSWSHRIIVKRKY